MLEQGQKILASLAALGVRRLVILGVTGLLVVAGTSVAGYLLSRPPFEVLYAGLDRQDVARIGAALREAGVAFDVSTDGANVLVASGQTSRARMLLAEQGLPHSSNVGYELFDKLGSLGLTSFMQDVTRGRAMEGELGRTIQTMHGVRSARVHLVLPDDGSFRRSRQPPSASVVIRADGRSDPAMARAIRHLVASAVAGMTPDMVTVLTTEGETLASGNEGDMGASNTMLSLERSLSESLQDNIRRTLAPYLGDRNIQVSVVARLNTDKKQTSETIFNPDSRVERSVRVIKENQVSQNSSSQAPTSVDRNIPDKSKSSDGKQSNEENQKREELTNYEVSSKSVSTVSGGYALERLSVAILVNRAGLGVAGAPPADEALARRVGEIEALAASAAGLRTDRGDTIKVSAVDFVGLPTEAEPGALSSLIDGLMRQAGTLINALAAVVVVALVLLFGLRPALRMAQAPPALASAPPPASIAAEAPKALASEEPAALGYTPPHPRDAMQNRLAAIVDASEQQTVDILRRWIRTGAAA